MTTGGTDDTETNAHIRLPLRAAAMSQNPPVKPPDSLHPNSRLLGRFLVKVQDATQTGLTAEQVVELLDTQAASVQEVFRIHRIDLDGRMELVGVSPAAFNQRDCLLFSRDRVKTAREDFDAIIQLAERIPPPCRIEVQFCHVKQFNPSHVVVMIFPTPCSEAVGQWLAATGFQPGDQADGSPAVLSRYENAGPQIVKQHIVTAASP